MPDQRTKFQVAAVVIGRNEGQRLEHCLKTLLGAGLPVVYADSGSTDGSADRAAELGAEVVRLDPTRPFTAARGRNEGFSRMQELWPGIDAVQFVDGDCQLAEGWIAAALAVLERRPGVALVTGSLLEKNPGASPYNRLMALDWATYEYGEIDGPGGIFLVRAAAFAAAGGFSEDVIAGEEYDLCTRIRESGWKLVRIDHDMAVHDAEMTRFGQWWKRCIRNGHSHAEGLARHGTATGRHGMRATLSTLLWCVLVPIVSLGGAWFSNGWSLGLLAIYPLQVLRIRRSLMGQGFAGGDAGLWAAFGVLAKFPEGIGQGKYWLARCFEKKSTIIEYK